MRVMHPFLVTGRACATLVAVAAVALLVTGCGGSSGSATATPAPAATTAVPTATPTTTFTATTTPATSAATAPQVPKACADVATLAMVSPSMVTAANFLGPSPAYPAVVKSTISQILTTFQTLAADAPADIKPTIDTYMAPWSAYATVLAKVNYQLAYLLGNPTLLQSASQSVQAIASPASQEALQHIKAWLQQNCGPPPEVPKVCVDFATLGSSLQAALSPFGVGAGTPTTAPHPTLIKNTITQVSAALQTLAADAPANIRPDIDTYMITPWSAYASAMAKTNYQVASLVSQPTLLQSVMQSAHAITSPTSPASQQAMQHVEAWLQQNCPQ